MSKYVLIGFATQMGGGQIYLSNKVRYLKNNGWQVYVIYSSPAQEIILESLKEYHQGSIYNIHFYPSMFSKKMQDQVINEMINFIDYQSGQDQIVIESHSLKFSLWGEILAERVQGKNFCFLLGASFPSGNTKEFYSFFDFKHQRGELAGTRKSSLPQLFGNYKEIKENDNKYLMAICTNSVEDYSYPLKIEKGKYDQIIGHVGRDYKSYVIDMVDEIMLYAQQNADKKILFVMVGGQKESTSGIVIERKINRAC